ncbi:hypothetical protein [Curtobacterium sp. MCBD17_040]|uniref:hypothetical protein n=1 Tax=Curtobacterium sp. MCBD17_040 TaxID=2175674 RepID=UPI000DA7B9EA|nr:hypothetical protein [Curtobacterium sp. MCBD17_040]WIB65742.1 hypothetical protein DEI94_16620 [Curtobacterium sp. MCBD17_040]
MYDPADAAADLQTAANAWDGVFSPSMTFAPAGDDATRYSFTFTIDDEQQQRIVVVGNADVFVVSAPTSYRTLLAAAEATTSAEFTAAVLDLARPGADRADLLLLGLDGGDVVYIDEVVIPQLPERFLGPALTAIIDALTNDDGTLLLTNPGEWTTSNQQVKQEQAALHGFEQWGDTNTWTYFVED